MRRAVIGVAKTVGLGVFSVAWIIYGLGTCAEPRRPEPAVARERALNACAAVKASTMESADDPDDWWTIAAGFASDAADEDRRYRRLATVMRDAKTMLATDDITTVQPAELIGKLEAVYTECEQITK